MIVVRRHHALGLPRAKRLAEGIARQLQDDYGGSCSWKGNDLHFHRTGASGSVAVTKDSIEIHVELGFLLSPLSSRIEREIHAFCDEHFGDEGPDPGRAPRPAAGRRKGTGPGRPK